MRRIRRCSVGVAALLAMVFAPVSLAQATSMDPTVIVLDASGSMTAQDVDGQSRMDSAKQAVNDFLDQTPEESKLGLLTYGTGTGSSEEEKEAGCKDITVLSRLGETPIADLKQKVNELQPRGYTPIGNSLLQANDLLPKEGKRSIVLVSDGIDTCAPPPVCDVAKQLKEQGTDLVVHTIGFMVDDAARAELSCVADVTGGTYSDASSAESLKANLTRAATRTGVSYQFSDKQVKFSQQLSDAPEITVGDLQHPTRIHAILPSGGDKESFAKIKIPNGMHLQVGYSTVPSFGTRKILEDAFGFFISPEDSSGSACYIDRSGLSDVVGSRPNAAFITGKEQGAKDNYCEGEYIYLHAYETADAPDDLDMTLALVPAQPSDYGDPFNKAATPDRTKDDLGKPAEARTTESVTPLSYPDTQAKPAHGTVIADIVEGETQYIPTEVSWGQALDVTVEILEDQAAEELTQTERTGRQLDISVLNELGQPQKILDDDSNQSLPSRSLDINAQNAAKVFGTERAISFANIKERSAAWLGGKHFVQISFNSLFRQEKATENTQSIPVKYRLTFTPVGNPVEGPTFTADASPTTNVSSAQSTTAANAEVKQTSSWGTLLNYAIIFGILLVVVVLIIGGIIFLSSKRRG
ncbi:vWA domain-containing protein [Corynebacterium freiburgense]|uniref:vWA domain-containing protein n=1 Tax=Corynebacterium freiburgense TaxID=556548 RepID=UPI000400FC87|nr:VWA domain-containing protein [Corynebacterium freiburgense]WJZ03408.1 von Willebrand factor type A domain protein [Corynebacterium freiburgense]